MNTPFYSRGLRFECTGCSRCCRHEPGYVFLSDNDLSRLCAAKELSRAEFLEKYCRSVNIHGFSRLSLREKDNYDCIFWKDGGCSVYESRPLQCRTYPFWEPFLNSREDWEAMSGECPGVNRGRLYSQKEIDRLLEARRSEALLSGDDA
ncbi:zinc/iron-chelating domain-containing protein [Marispirochaeta aestuarii]|uniref:Zinc/iron-chelating domain-containing protein n=1 Tax=Marispirochaeta aestuarii TaxID=1963862 RepID=A0A1Y1S095_9SPIO|nr:YkgJ family cysteine cluster protein [Marispirochaeta aestuarii]ORC36612.1 zinc/iron-chelating domain-containing protein [Marispirochaeta aestuarii]